MDGMLSAGLADASTAMKPLAQLAEEFTARGHMALNAGNPSCHEEVSLIGTHQQGCTSVRVVG